VGAGWRYKKRRVIELKKFLFKYCQRSWRESSWVQPHKAVDKSKVND